MSQRPLFRLCEAMEVANRINGLLAPFCQDYATVGSVRRRKQYVADVEVLFLPKLLQGDSTDLFNPAEPVFATDKLFNDLLATGVIEKRKNAAGGFTWGPLNKLAVDCETGVPVDLFCEPNAADWARSMVIRTGPKELNIRLIEGARSRGIQMHAYGNAFTRIGTDEVVRCATEWDVFNLCGLPWAEPEERTK